MDRRPVAAIWPQARRKGQDPSDAMKNAKNLPRRFAQFKKALYNSSSLQAVSSAG
jgi:hypothetical protein